MSCSTGCCLALPWCVNVPWISQRQHENAIIEGPKHIRLLIDQCKRMALITLPLLKHSVYPILGANNLLWKALSLRMKGLRGVSSISKLHDGLARGDTTQIASGVLQTTLSAASVVGTIFAPPIGHLISTGQDLTINVESLFTAYGNGDLKKAGETGAKIVLSSLYLGTFFSCSVGLRAMLSSAQVLSSLYFLADELQKGNNLVSGAHLLMALWRLPQLAISSIIYEHNWNFDRDDCDLD